MKTQTTKPAFLVTVLAMLASGTAVAADKTMPQMEMDMHGHHEQMMGDAHQKKPAAPAAGQKKVQPAQAAKKPQNEHDHGQGTGTSQSDKSHTSQ